MLLLCEKVLDEEIRGRIELHSHEMDADAILLGMVPNDPSVVDLDEKHLNQATRSLTVALEGVAWFTSKLDRLEGTVDVLAEFNDHFSAYLPKDQYFGGLNAEFEQRMTALRARISGYRAHANRMQLQGQAMVQTVDDPTPYFLRTV